MDGLWGAVRLMLQVAAFASSSQAVNIQHADCGKGHDNLRDLKVAVVLYRHGDRAPIHSYPTDPHPISIWPDGPGSLTKRGIRQAFRLGQYLGKRYCQLIRSMNGTSQILVTSSGVSRTLKTAMSVNAGLYPPTPQQVWSRKADGTELGHLWQPIPVFSTPVKDEAVFAQAECPRFHQIRHQNGPKDDPNGYEEKYKDLMRYIQNHTQIPHFEFPGSFSPLNDVLYAQSQNGYSLPDWVTPEVQKNIAFMATVAFHQAAGSSDPDDLIRPRLKGGNMLRVITETLMKASNGSTENRGVKLFLYAGHDTVMAGILVALQQYDYGNDAGILSGRPNYAASLMFELFNNNTVRISYRNNKPEGPEAEPTILIHPKCTTFCPVEELAHLASPYVMTPQEYFQECKPLPGVPIDHGSE